MRRLSQTFVDSGARLLANTHASSFHSPRHFQAEAWERLKSPQTQAPPCPALEPRIGINRSQAWQEAPVTCTMKPASALVLLGAALLLIWDASGCLRHPPGMPGDVGFLEVPSQGSSEHAGLRGVVNLFRGVSLREGQLVFVFQIVIFAQLCKRMLTYL